MTHAGWWKYVLAPKNITLILNLTKLYRVCSFTRRAIGEILGKYHSGDAQTMMYCREAHLKERGSL